jgi:hypothetical protein
MPLKFLSEGGCFALVCKDIHEYSESCVMKPPVEFLVGETPVRNDSGRRFPVFHGLLLF